MEEAEYMRRLAMGTKPSVRTGIKQIRKDLKLLDAKTDGASICPVVKNIFAAPEANKVFDDNWEMVTDLLGNQTLFPGAGLSVSPQGKLDLSR